MERVGTLINKLKEQLDQQTDPAQMVVTAQLLLAELQARPCEDKGSAKVSVFMPAAITVQQVVNEPVITPSFPELPKSGIKKEEQTGWLFEEPMTIPTMIHQNFEPGKDINELLRTEDTEVATMLEESPIRDLKKAISVNDRYLFINNLFRGDENMFERSIRTINSFNIYPEAQYWIQRELKVKLSWTEGSDTVKLFDQLVKRRFA